MTPVRAAGGLVWRPGPGGTAEVCLVYRERHGDWALPKGKLEPGEHPLAAAVREVREETGISATPQLPLARSRYRVGDRPKTVDYWVMSAPSQIPEFQPNSEVDAVTWLPVTEAAARLSYPADAELVRRWGSVSEVTGAVLVVRHAFAGRRDEWSGDDRARPLTRDGSAGAQRLCAILELFAPGMVVSAPPQRCRQTLAPLAVATGLPVQVVACLDQQTGDRFAAAARLRQLAADQRRIAVCLQGEMVGPILGELTGTRTWRRPTGKGDGWLVPFAGTKPLPPSRLAVGPPAYRGRPDRG